MNRPPPGSGAGSANTSGACTPDLPADAQHRLTLSRALILQAIQQPSWLLLAQRACASAAPSDQDRRQAQTSLFDICLQSLVSTSRCFGTGRARKTPDASDPTHTPQQPAAPERHPHPRNKT